MRHFIDVQVLVEGKTGVRVNAQVIAGGVPVIVGTGKAQSVSRAVTLALEEVWDGLVERIVAEGREVVAEARKGSGPLPDHGPLFTTELAAALARDPEAD